MNKQSVTPPGWEPTVKKMKKHEEITNPWALAWWMKNQGYEPGGKKSEDVDIASELIHVATLILSRGSQCDHFKADSGTCRTGCNKRNKNGVITRKGYACPWDGDWDEASEDCPCYKS